jgi:transcriptional regulator with PAS, ATPase and Fis domain
MKFVSPDTLAADAVESLDLEGLLADTRWATLADLLPDGIVLVDRTGFVRFLNSAAESLNELLRSEVVGRSLAHLIQRSALDCDLLLDAFRTGTKLNQFIASPTRQRCLISTRAVRDRNGELTSFLIVLRDAEQLMHVRPDPTRAAYVASHDTEPDQGMVLCVKTAALADRGLKALSLGSRLLLLGESGVGKTAFARLLHRRSAVATQPFINVNCGGIPETLFESEMFGYERGSFTGASSKGKKGLVEAADGGILFLDEIGEIPLSSQSKMLQFLEDNALHRVGATQAKRLHVQVIAATNRNLRDMLSLGTFRRDLYHRLSVVTLTLPALRDCPEVIDRLIDRFVTQVNRRRPLGLRIDARSRRCIGSYAFPGNVRELQNLIEHLAVTCDGNVSSEDVKRALTECGDADGASPSADVDPQALAPGPLKVAVRRYESRLIRDAIRRAGSKRKAAELLGVDIATIVRKSRRPN